MDIRKYVDLLKDYGHRLAFENHVAFFQCVEALIGGHDKGSENGLLGEVMEQEDYMTEWEERKYDAALQQAFFQRMMQAYFFGDIDMARQMSKNMWSPFEEGPDVLLPFRVFFLGMTALSSYILTKKRSHRRKGKKMIKIMERWDSHGVVNVHHMLFLLKAEYNAGTSMDFTKVRRSFDEAISIAARCGFLHFQGENHHRDYVCLAFLDLQCLTKSMNVSFLSFRRLQHWAMSAQVFTVGNKMKMSKYLLQCLFRGSIASCSPTNRILFCCVQLGSIVYSSGKRTLHGLGRHGQGPKDARRVRLLLGRIGHATRSRIYNLLKSSTG